VYLREAGPALPRVWVISGGGKVPWLVRGW
jgi:hypothetical protein